MCPILQKASLSSKQRRQRASVGFLKPCLFEGCCLSQEVHALGWATTRKQTRVRLFFTSMSRCFVSKQCMPGVYLNKTVSFDSRTPWWFSRKIMKRWNCLSRWRKNYKLAGDVRRLVSYRPRNTPQPASDFTFKVFTHLSESGKLTGKQWRLLNTPETTDFQIPEASDFVLMSRTSIYIYIFFFFRRTQSSSSPAPSQVSSIDLGWCASRTSSNIYHSKRTRYHKIRSPRNELICYHCEGMTSSSDFSAIIT